MRLPQNIGTIQRWLKAGSEREIVESLQLFGYHFRGAHTRSGEPLPADSGRWLATWDWQAFGDPLQVAERAGVL